MPTVLTMLLYALAVSRLTTLITTDEISRPARQNLVKHFNPTRRAHRWIVYAIGSAEDETANGCPWCVSIWVGALTAPILWVCGQTPYFMIPTIALAVSQVTGMTFRIGRQ